jgi:hypothetical protein
MPRIPHVGIFAQSSIAGARHVTHNPKQLKGLGHEIDLKTCRDPYARPIYASQQNSNPSRVPSPFTRTHVIQSLRDKSQTLLKCV